jgi:hypothetical protein
MTKDDIIAFGLCICFTAYALGTFSPIIYYMIGLNLGKEFTMLSILIVIPIVWFILPFILGLTIYSLVEYMRSCARST